MKIIIQKFGGTSVATGERRKKAAAKVLKAVDDGYSPVVVVSAMGRKGAPYATDSLALLMMDASDDLREMDALLSCGEIISSVVFASLLRHNGQKAKSLTGIQAGIITDGIYSKAGITKIDPISLIKLVSDGVIPVVAGFQGAGNDGDIVTLGRGASDTTAAALGEALSVEKVEIYTDVNGIMTADPKVVPNAVVMDRISYQEVFQMADEGAKVIHPNAVEIAMRSGIPLIIKNTFADHPGTIITSCRKPYNGDGSHVRVVMSIAHMKDRAQVIIENTDSTCEETILKQLAGSDISIDLINIFPDRLIFTIDVDKVVKASEILNNIKSRYSIIKKCAKISAIGSGMRGVPGVMSRMVGALMQEGIKILQTADSHMTLSCLVSEDDLLKAANALHREFELEL